jgi:hypothetical protein
MDSIDKKVELLGKWIDQHKKDVEMFSTIKIIHEASLIQRDIVNNMPPQLGGSGELSNLFTTDLSYLEQNLSVKSQSTFDPDVAIGLFMSGSTSGYSYINNFEISDKDLIAEGKKWKFVSGKQVEVLIGDAEQIKFIDTKYRLLFPRNASQFNDSVVKYKAFTTGIATESDLLYSIRNVMDYLHGQIPNAAKKIAIRSGVEMKNSPSWSSTCDYVVKNGKGTQEHKELVKMNQFYEQNHSRISNAAKQSSQLGNDLTTKVYTEYLGYVYTILSLIDIEKVKEVLLDK